MDRTLRRAMFLFAAAPPFCHRARSARSTHKLRLVAKKPDIDVAHVAKLARLNLTEEETKLFQAQLGLVLEYAEKLREPDTSHVEASAHAVPIFNVFREDEPQAGFTAEEALSNAPRQANGLFIVTKGVE